jgi:hypothetical protein
LVAESKEIIRIDDDGRREPAVGQITRQQIRVFAMFSAALFMTGLAYAFSINGDTPIALASMMTAVAFASAIFLEARSS